MPDDREKLCEDCEEEIPKGRRRSRCKNCGTLCCSYCLHHIHKFAAMISRNEAKKGTQP